MTDSNPDPFDLHRFAQAQEGVYEQALSELRAGRKRTHWMWFVFPQIAGLGRSHTAQRYAISGVDEARAYLDHPMLGPRLIQSAQAALDSDAASTYALLGSPDDQKLRSSMTLFDAVSDADQGGRILNGRQVPPVDGRQVSGDFWLGRRLWVPAFAGMTSGRGELDRGEDNALALGRRRVRQPTRPLLRRRPRRSDVGAALKQPTASSCREWYLQGWRSPYVRFAQP